MKKTFSYFFLISAALTYSNELNTLFNFNPFKRKSIGQTIKEAEEDIKRIRVTYANELILVKLLDKYDPNDDAYLLVAGKVLNTAKSRSGSDTIWTGRRNISIRLNSYNSMLHNSLNRLTHHQKNLNALRITPEDPEFSFLETVKINLSELEDFLLNIRDITCNDECSHAINEINQEYFLALKIVLLQYAVIYGFMYYLYLKNKRCPKPIQRPPQFRRHLF